MQSIDALTRRAVYEVKDMADTAKWDLPETQDVSSKSGTLRNLKRCYGANATRRIWRIL
jgi:hypothetical protein